jgi:hypothetical protein
MLNAGLVNAFRLEQFSRQNARFSANSPGNLHFRNPVKYNLRPRINNKSGTAGRILEAVAFEIASQNMALAPA